MIPAVGFENRRQGLKERIRETYDRATTAAWTGEGVTQARALEPGRGESGQIQIYFKVIRMGRCLQSAATNKERKKESKKEHDSKRCLIFIVWD